MKIQEAICEMKKGKVVELDSFVYRICGNELYFTHENNIDDDITDWSVEELDLNDMDSDKWKVVNKETLSDNIVYNLHYSNFIRVDDIKVFLCKLKVELGDKGIDGYHRSQKINELAGKDLID